MIRTSWRIACLAVLVVALVAAVVGFGRSQQKARYGAVVPSGSLRFVPAPPRVLIDWPLWLSEKRLLVTTLRQQYFALLSLDLRSGAYSPVTTLKPPDCRVSGASRPAWSGRKVVYLSDCFPFPDRVDSARSVLASLDPRTGRNRRFGLYRFSIAMSGQFSFSPGGARGVIDSGGLYSRLEWLAPIRPVPIDQGLAIAVGPAWSPDGDLIVFDGAPKAKFNDLEQLRTNMYTFKPSNPKRLHLVISGLKDKRQQAASWLPNSKWVVSYMHPPDGPDGLWLLDVGSGHKVLLVAGTEFGQPAVSPDGRSVAVGIGVNAQTPGHDVKDPRIGTLIIPLPSARQLEGMLH